MAARGDAEGTGWPGATFGVAAPVIGVLHLPPLPGSPGAGLTRDEILDWVARDLAALRGGGVDGLLLENFGDAPFHRDDVPDHTVAFMSVLAARVRDSCDLPLGVNVLRNDARAALSVATAAGADFIRVNVWTGARVTDQGIVEGRAHEVLRLRRQLESRVRVLADVGVKHSAPLGERPVEEEARDAAERGGADALVVTGPSTGRPPEVDRVERVRDAAGDTPVLVGSGVTEHTVAALLGRSDGVIVGTALKRGGDVRAPVDRERVERFMAAARGEPAGRAAGVPEGSDA